MENKAKLSRAEFGVLRIAKMNLKKQTQCQNRQYSVSSLK